MLITETRKELSGLIYALRFVWSSSSRRRYSLFYKYWRDLSVTPDNVIQNKDCVCIPSTQRKTILDHLHQSHAGRDRMTAVARQMYWWPGRDSDISNYVRNCVQCGLKPNTHPTHSSLPATFQPLQRVHMDYCGPILGKFYVLVVNDTYLRYPEIFITKSANSNFTKVAMQKYMSRFGIPQTLETNNGTHFNA